MSAEAISVAEEGNRTVWDLPLRLCHWLLAVSVPAAYFTAEWGGAWAPWHGRIGAFVLGLLIFRMVWGFVGTTHARFASFMPTPKSVREYIGGTWEGPGHNPLGAVAVFAMLFALIVQVSTGLFANDDISFEGPLAAWVSKSTSDVLTGLHHQGFDVLLALIVLHLAAIAFYVLVRRSNLVAPMLSGGRPARLSVPVPEMRLLWRSFATAAAASAVLVWAVFGGVIEPPAPPAESAPAAAW